MRGRGLGAALLACAACAVDPTSSVPTPRAPMPAARPFTPPPGFTRLRIGLTPSFSPETLKASHVGLARYLSRELGIPVEIEVAESYDAVAEHLRKGDYDFVELSPFAYVRARAKVKLRPLVTAIADGSETAAGYVLVREDSPYKTLEDLRGATAGFVDPASTSGYLYPLKVFRDRGLDPATFFSKVEFLGNHEAVLMALLEDRIDVGSSYQGALPALKRSRGIDPLSFRIIAKTQRTPRDAYCVREDLPTEVAEAIANRLLRLSARDHLGREVLGPLTINGFASVDDGMYDQVRAVQKELFDAGTP